MSEKLKELKKEMGLMGLTKELGFETALYLFKNFSHNDDRQNMKHKIVDSFYDFIDEALEEMVKE